MAVVVVCAAFGIKLTLAESRVKKHPCEPEDAADVLTIEAPGHRHK